MYNSLDIVNYAVCTLQYVYNDKHSTSGTDNSHAIMKLYEILGNLCQRDNQGGHKSGDSDGVHGKPEINASGQLGNILCQY
jgi:hypothetical protein